jgi:sugar (pentulose or hexulose) kinase
MTDVALGIDFGTSGVRIAAVDREMNVVRIATAPIAVPVADGHRSRQDSGLWWQALLAAFAVLDLAGYAVKALAVDGTSGTILPVAANGSALDLASMYNDAAGKAELARLASAAPAGTAALGNTSPLARAMTMQAGAARILHQADWIVGQLTGRFDVTDENNALKSGYDPVARNWPRWIANAGFDVSLFPTVVPVGTVIARVTAEASDRLGLPRDCMVVAGTTDGCAAFLASGASDPGDGVTSLGTTLTLKLLSAKPVFSPLFGIYSHRIGDRWLAGGASNVGGGVLGQFFSKEDLARLTLLLDPSRPTGLHYYPLPKAGERFPVNDPAKQPVLEPRPAADHAFFQAILEGIAEVEAMGYRRLQELGATPLASIRSVGGGAANAAWTTIRLEKLKVPAKSSMSEHAAVGTARLAWLGVGHET